MVHSVAETMNLRLIFGGGHRGARSGVFKRVPTTGLLAGRLNIPDFAPLSCKRPLGTLACDKTTVGVLGTMGVGGWLPLELLEEPPTW